MRYRWLLANLNGAVKEYALASICIPVGCEIESSFGQRADALPERWSSWKQWTVSQTSNTIQERRRVFSKSNLNSVYSKQRCKVIYVKQCTVKGFRQASDAEFRMGFVIWTKSSRTNEPRHITYLPLLNMRIETENISPNRNWQYIRLVTIRLKKNWPWGELRVDFDILMWWYKHTLYAQTKKLASICYKLTNTAICIYVCTGTRPLTDIPVRFSSMRYKEAVTDCLKFNNISLQFIIDSTYYSEWV